MTLLLLPKQIDFVNPVGLFGNSTAEIINESEDGQYPAVAIMNYGDFQNDQKVLFGINPTGGRYGKA